MEIQTLTFPTDTPDSRKSFLEKVMVLFSPFFWQKRGAKKKKKEKKAGYFIEPHKRSSPVLDGKRRAGFLSRLDPSRSLQLTNSEAPNNVSLVWFYSQDRHNDFRGPHLTLEAIFLKKRIILTKENRPIHARVIEENCGNHRRCCGCGCFLAGIT